ncbi:MAG TPA: hypothetical protein VE870_05435 [Bacteroidales bacterium]|nr:hypothetical protein [Bacteroidales bacterium]
MNLKKIPYLIVLPLLFTARSWSDYHSPGVVYHPVSGAAWQVKLSDIDGNGKNELICSTYHGMVCCNNPDDDSLRWPFDTGSFIFDLDVDDIDNDGKPVGPAMPV